MPKSLTISLNDASFPDYLDFDTLRIKGREHIARLSGEIWSDHNVHDPGITIMEVLTYAILDIGYRNQLPIEELLAFDRTGREQEENFFTAAQILSCNPLTILDFRKLILDIHGVRNVWLEVTDEAEVDLVVDCKESHLRYKQSGLQFPPLRLNGLYKVYLELEPEEILKATNIEATEVVKKVKCMLWEHRNLCEDFVEIKVLGDEEIAFCAEIELTSNADPDDTMVKILEVIDHSLSPSISYYTLEQLLAKGKTMDEIFEGRPLKTAKKSFIDGSFGTNGTTPSGQAASNSRGFIDTEELMKFDRIQEIRVSDLYREIMKIPEVRGIKNLILQSYVDGQPKSGQEKWCLRISDGRRPVLAPARAHFTFYKNVLPFVPDKKAVVERLKKRLINIRKTELQPYDLDFEPPLGAFRGDLKNYRSIQNDFPVVYGIGKGHLSPAATAIRRAKARQLKGYLLFFDQLLANYLSQMAKVRTLFSLRPESMRKPEDKRTYFAQQLKGVPEAKDLLRFYGHHNANGSSSQTIAVWAIEDDALPQTPEERDFAIQESILAFRNSMIRIEAVQDDHSGQYGYLVRDHLRRPLLESKQLYQTGEEAIAGAEELRFLATLKQAYRPVVQMLGNTRRYTFEILYNPLGYWSYLNTILETEEEYLERRDAFLNHLLARFSEHFTDYTLLMYALNGQRRDLRESVRDKSEFLYRYPEISRNRGRAYNYSAPGAIWNTDNISGVERRVTAMMGIPDFHRQTLSNFQTASRDNIYYYRLFHNGVAVFVSRWAYPEEEMAKQKLEDIGNLFNKETEYRKIDCQESGSYTFKLVSSDDNEAIHPAAYPTEGLRDEMIKTLVAELSLTFYDPLTTINPKVKIRRPDDSSDDPETSGDPVTSPYTYTGNVFIKTNDCDILDADEVYGYNISDEEDICAQHPATYSSGPYENVKAKLLERRTNLDSQCSGLCFGTGKVVLEKKDGSEEYYYQLCDMKSGLLLWRSRVAFPSAQAAYEAFERDFFTLIELARDEENYQEETVDGKTILLLRRGEGDFPAMVPAEELEEVSVEDAMKIRLEHALRFPVIREENNEEEVGKTEKICGGEVPQIEACGVKKELFRFQVVDLSDDLAVDWVSTQVFNQPIAAWRAFLKCKELIQDERNWFKTGEEDKDNLGLVVGEVLLNSTLSYGSEEEAWEGTQDFATHFKEEYALNTFVDFWEGCYCGYQVVNEQYHLARHSYSYNTSEERDLILDYWRKKAREREAFFTLLSPGTGNDGNGKYHYLICGELEECTEAEPEQTLWQSCKVFEKKSEALKAYHRDHIDIMRLARSAENYHFIKAEGECHVVLHNEQGTMVALIPESFDPGDSALRLQEIVKRIKLAYQFPIKETGAGFQFDIYDPDFDRAHLLGLASEGLADVRTDDYDLSSGRSPTSLPPYNDCGEEEREFLLDHVKEVIGGGIILESSNAYSSLDEAYAVIQSLQVNSYLFRQLASYHPTQQDSCGTFSFEWVNPGGILAVSPRRFSRHSDCLKAIQHSKDKVNAEGLHLLEHLLLRPLRVPVDKYIIQAKDEEGNVLFHSTEKYSDIAAANAGKTAFMQHIRAAAKKIYRRLKSDQALVQFWQKPLVLEDHKGKVITTELLTSANKQAFKEQINALRRLKEDELEAALLESTGLNGSLLKICVEPTKCMMPSASVSTERCGRRIELEENVYDAYIPGADPYSFWVSVVIPYWPRRFQNLNFRSFFENTLRRELPAYVAPNIIWANPRDMKAFEQAYRDWLAAKSRVVIGQARLAGQVNSSQESDCPSLQRDTLQDDTHSHLEAAMDALDTAQRTLIKVLCQLESEYPSARLQRFESGGGVILNQTTLA